MKYILPTLLIVTVILSIVFLHYASRPIVIEKWIEPSEVKPLVFEFDVNEGIHIVRYAFYNELSYILKVRVIDTSYRYVDSLTWYRAKPGQRLKGDWPMYDRNIHKLNPPTIRNPE